MAQLAVEVDGILFGYTDANKRACKSLNYHRQPNLKPSKAKWESSIGRYVEYYYFSYGEAHVWLSASRDYWWVSKGAKTTVGLNGERLAFFPMCSAGPWRGYPVSALTDRNYEVPGEIIVKWEADHTT